MDYINKIPKNKQKLARVPSDWWDRQRANGKTLGVSTPKAILIGERVAAEVIKKLKKNGDINIEIKI